jgi:transcriptional regulator with XRE-family HTH domain
VSDLLKPFVANLRARREELGLTQADVAWKAYMDQSYYSRLERGLVDPSIRMVARVAAALQIEAYELLRGVRATARSRSE